jgi:hypothetical protein
MVDVGPKGIDAEQSHVGGIESRKEGTLAPGPDVGTGGASKREGSVAPHVGHDDPVVPEIPHVEQAAPAAEPHGQDAEEGEDVSAQT